VDATWLGDRRAVDRADAWVRGRLAHHRGKRGRSREDIGAMSVDRLVADVRSLGVDGRWLWVTAATCLLAELLFAATFGGTFRDVRAPVDREGKVAFQGLLILRNVTFHPAHAASDAGSGVPHMTRFGEHLRGNGDAGLAHALAESWAAFAGRPVSSYAIRMLDAAARAHPDTKHHFPSRFG
jgi:hypothetical protein